MKRLLLLLVLAVTGAGLAYGTSVALFSPASERANASEPLGLVEDLPRIALDRLETQTPTAEPSPSAPAAVDVGGGRSGPGQAHAAAAPAPLGDADPTFDSDRPAARGAPISTSTGPVAKDPTPTAEEECAGEENAQERHECDREVDTEADEHDDEEHDD